MSDNKWEEEWVVEWVPEFGRKVRMIYDSAKDALSAMREIRALGFAADAYRRMVDATVFQVVEENPDDV